MPRYIDADLLKLGINKNDEIFCTPVRPLIIDLIDNMPTADVQPVKHGHWEYRGRDTDGRLIYKCSECGYTLSVAPEMNLAMSHEKFCYKCGARMGDDSE